MPTNDLAALSEAATCTLAECPPGLFWLGDTLGFKSEYTTTLENPRRYQCDAYVVSSGEYFHGGAHSTEERAALIVRPVGDIVLINREGVRERAVNSIRDTDDPGAELAAVYADAALAAILGEG